MPQNAIGMDSIRVYDIDAELSQATTPTQRALLKAGVKILDNDDVAIYMGAKLREARARARELVRAQPPPKVPARRGRVFWPFLLVAVGGGLIYLGVAFLPALAATLCLMAGVVLAIAGIAAGESMFPESVVPVPRSAYRDYQARAKLSLLAWRPYPAGEVHCGQDLILRSIHAAGQPDIVLPPEALAVCERIRRTDHHVEFEVVQLDDDPFLCTVGEVYYLCVWDETGCRYPLQISIVAGYVGCDRPPGLSLRAFGPRNPMKSCATTPLRRTHSCEMSHTIPN
jgi:hypothetical protein